MRTKRKRRRIAELFDFVSESDFRKRSCLSFLQSYFNDRDIKDKIILDAGCGCGEACFYFANRRPKRVLGIDISSKAIAAARDIQKKRNLNNISFQIADMQALPFADRVFDFVIALGSLQYVPESFKAIDELCRVGKDSTQIILVLSRELRFNYLFKMARRFISLLPFNLSRVFALLLSPLGYFLKKNTNLKEKSMQDQIVESLFSSVYNFHKPAEVSKYLKSRGFDVEITPFLDVKSLFVLKARR